MTKKPTTKKPAPAKPQTKAAKVDAKDVSDVKAPPAQARHVLAAKDAGATKPAPDADLLTVSDVAREMGIDPKAARAALRRSGRGTDGKRYAKVLRDSKEHTALLLFFEGNQDGVDSSPK